MQPLRSFLHYIIFYVHAQTCSVAAEPCLSTDSETQPLQAKEVTVTTCRMGFPQLAPFLARGVIV